MPIYEYQCDECGHEFEVMQRMSDDRLTTCPSCNKESLRKLVSAAGFQLKGTGWYETDFKNSGKPAKPKDEGGSKESGGDAKPKADKKSETKTESSASKSAE